ncbi:hypothetical protein BDV26DRAFT_79068 [Aspergillus bertholletiae]|uniref:Uncharacterized protein n=1 Tax=Aspergillus bertholletiae TaxID=1226010 RepID=A0A5N7BIG0_9EURO|nr:hypothetical protein BDV26DRAFT_79068 [Aspergillus bertholletiae]
MDAPLRTFINNVGIPTWKDWLVMTRGHRANRNKKYYLLRDKPVLALQAAWNT